MKRQGGGGEAARNLPQLSEQWCRIKIVKRLPEAIIGRLGDAYSLRGAYEKALQKKDPLLSPHGVFRRLAKGNPKHAAEFLQEFGPLTAERWEEPYVRVDLPAFWAAQQQFCSAARLYESRNDHAALGKALDSYLEQQPPSPVLLKWAPDYPAIQGGLISADAAEFTEEFQRYNARTVEEIVTNRSLDEAIEPRKAPAAGVESSTIPPWLDQVYKRCLSENLEDLRVLAAEYLRHQLDIGGISARFLALNLLELEIERHTYGLRFTWGRSNPQSDAFRHCFQVDSLLAAIWDFFASDTAATPWRICPHCGKVFYPPRSDRFYCTTRQQTLASKRRYDLQRLIERKKQRRRRK